MGYEYMPELHPVVEPSFEAEIAVEGARNYYQLGMHVYGHGAAERTLVEDDGTLFLDM